MCLAVKPIVDRLEKELAGKVVVLRLNVNKKVGMDTADLYDIRSVPTFVVFDDCGRERWRQRVSSPDRCRILQNQPVNTSDQ